MNETIQHFIDTKSIAVVGVSDKKFGGAIYKTLKKRGYDVSPVHPTRDKFDGDKCYSKLTDLPDEIKTAIIAVSPKNAEMVVENAIKAGFTHLWFQQGADFTDSIKKVENSGIRTVSKKCILMYAEPVTGIHSLHRFLARLFNKA
ncbi:MAG: CoA-binding protein [candidate division Zixibacteria bacterium]|nr:CoA-binding protein [candidate division Zixibacteria bacterium]